MTMPSPLPRVLFGTAVVLGVLAGDGSGGGALTASLLIAMPGGEDNGVWSMVAWLVGGSLAGAGLAYAGATVLTIPLSTTAAIGLGIALGGGAGALTRSVSGGDPAPADEVTVEMDRDTDPEPAPADLFEGHPDPLVYVVDEGHGPVVRAANPAFESTFDLPAQTLAGTPFVEVLRMDGAETIADAVRDGEPLDSVYDCPTADGTRPFRVRSVGAETDGYVLFTPVQTE
jgi:hypothetical protein